MTPRLFVALAVVPAITLALALTPAPELIVRDAHVVGQGDAAHLEYDVGR